jgi:hypothetical protein
LLGKRKSTHPPKISALLTRLSLESLLKATIRKALLLLCHVKPIKEVLRVVTAVKKKREKEVSRRNRYVFYVLWIEQETL